jgi:hypothetical protein
LRREVGRGLMERDFVGVIVVVGDFVVAGVSKLELLETVVAALEVVEVELEPLPPLLPLEIVVTEASLGLLTTEVLLLLGVVSAVVVESSNSKLDAEELLGEGEVAGV